MDLFARLILQLALTVMPIEPAFAANELCLNSDDLNEYSGTWVFEQFSNADNCTLTQSNTLAFSKIWFGESDGVTANDDYVATDSFVIKSSLSVASGGQHGAGVTFGITDMESNFYFFEIYPEIDRVQLWKCCDWALQWMIESMTIEWDVIYDMEIIANKINDEYVFDFVINDQVMVNDWSLSDYDAGSVGFAADYAGVTVYSFTYCESDINICTNTISTTSSEIGT